METITRSVQCALLQSNLYLNLPHVVLPNSTLNEKLNIAKDISLADTDRPHFGYVVIGNGAHKVSTGTNGLVITDSIPHRPRDAGLYNMIPLVLRLPQNDLTVSERSKYRLRRTESHDGKAYIAYYAKVLDRSETAPTLEFRTVADGVTTSTAYVPTIADLNPTPPVINSQGAISTTGDYVAATAKVPFVFDANDITELRNVAKILYKDEKYAVFSELGLCSGVDRSVTGDFGGISSTYTEVIAAQISCFYVEYHSVGASSEGVDLTFDVGASEALLATNS